MCKDQPQLATCIFSLLAESHSELIPPQQKSHTRTRFCDCSIVANKTHHEHEWCLLIIVTCVHFSRKIFDSILLFFNASASIWSVQCRRKKLHQRCMFKLGFFVVPFTLRRGPAHGRERKLLVSITVAVWFVKNHYSGTSRCLHRCIGTMRLHAAVSSFHSHFTFTGLSPVGPGRELERVEGTACGPSSRDKHPFVAFLEHIPTH